MKALCLLTLFICLDVHGASFTMLWDRDVDSQSLVDIRKAAHELQKLSPADDDLIYKFNGIYKVKASKGQQRKAILRQFLRYNSEWRASSVDIYKRKEVGRREILDGLFSEGEQPSERTKKKAFQLVKKMASILRNNKNLELYYYTSSSEDIYSTDGWLVYNQGSFELLAVDVSINYEF